MNLSAEMQKVFTDEVITIVRQMRDVSTPEEKVYFFSAAHGVAHRIVNIEFDPELLFIHFVLNQAYGMLTMNLSAIRQGQTIVTIAGNVFGKLEDALEDMVNKIEQGERTHLVLERISNLAYSTTGNGYYLYLKGMLVV